MCVGKHRLLYCSSSYRSRGYWIIRAALALCAACAVARSTSAKDQPKTEAYENGKPHFVYSVDSEGRKNGDYRELSPEGRVLVAATYLKDQLNGPYKSLYPNGRPKVSAAYAGGKLSGKYREYKESGEVAVAAIYKAGDLNGARQEMLPDGAVRTENWNLGKLHGWRRDAAKDRLVNEQFWYDGQLLIPKGPLLISQELAAIQKRPIDTVGGFPKVSEKLSKTLSSEKFEASNEAGLRKLMEYRFICDVPYKDMQLDRDYMAHAQAAAEILVPIGHLTHTPDNPGWPEDEYQFAYKGTSSCNLDGAPGSPVTAYGSVEDYMNDSDQSNIDRVGHRRWCINPTMLKTGFGATQGFSAMWSFDGSRTDSPDYDIIAFPPRGLIPTSHFKSSYAWTISPNPRKYAPPDTAIKVTVTPTQFDPRRVSLTEASDPLGIENFNVSTVEFGGSRCIIFRPKNVNVAAGSVYKVTVDGLKDIQGQGAPLEYFVGFFDLVKK